MAIGKTLEKKAESTRKVSESLKDEAYRIMFESDAQKKQDTIHKKILMSGDNGTGKTSLALFLMTYNLKDDECIIHIDVDRSGAEIIKDFFEEEELNHQIRPFKPIATIERDGATVLDEEGMVNLVTSASAAVQQAIDNGIKVKGVIIDGVSFLLEYAEAKMRLDKGLDADSGAQLNAWKIRSQFFREFTSAYMGLDVPVMFISHEDFIPEGKEKFAEVKKRLISECSMRIVVEKEDSIENPHITYYNMIVKKNRSDIFAVGKNITFMTVNNETQKIENNYEEAYNLIFPPNPSKKDKG